MGIEGAGGERGRDCYDCSLITYFFSLSITISAAFFFLSILHSHIYHDFDQRWDGVDNEAFWWLSIKHPLSHSASTFVSGRNTEIATLDLSTPDAGI